MKLYISGTFTAQERLRAAAEELTKMGHHVDANWLTDLHKPKYLTVEQFQRIRGIEDLAEVVACECIILDNDGTSTSGGRYTEWGIAIAPGACKLKIWIGENKKGVFSNFADYYFKDWKDCIEWLKSSKIGL